MNWLKHIKKWLHAEEEIIEIEEIIIDEPLEPEQLASLDFSKHKQADEWKKEQSREEEKQKRQNQSQKPVLFSSHTPSKEPDAKVLFQYPKGTFKFPIIPDQPPENLPKRKPKKTSGPEDIKKDKPLQDREGQEHKKKEATGREERKPSKVLPSNKPFRPTEIPSPVYGFKRPGKEEKKKEEIIEFELKSNIVHSEPEPAVLDIPAVFRKSEEPVEKGIAEDTDISREDTASIPLEQADKEEKAPAIQESAAALAPVQEEAFEYLPEEWLEISPELSEAEGEEPVELKAEEAAPEMLLSSAGTSLPSQTEAVQDADLDEEKQETGEEQEEPDPAYKAKPIPFNVVMLKGDRDKRITQKKSLNKAESPFAAAAVPAAVSAVPAEPVLTAAESSPSVSVISEQAPEAKCSPLEPVHNGPRKEEEVPYYALPHMDFLTPPSPSESDDEWLEEQSLILDETLKNFNVKAKVVNVTQGPSVTRFEVQPEPGVKVNKVTNLLDDIKLSLAAADLRMEAPIPGKHTIGIEIPNRKSKPVFLREVLEDKGFEESESPLTAALGLDISGNPVVTDLKKMPHGLIAGATGSGKSVCINSILISLLYKAAPQELKLLLIDPKMVELAPYNRIPHLVSPVITDVKAATAALKWAVEEMERRYELFANAGVRDIGRFNQQAEAAGQHAVKLPYLLIIIDELADLMMVSPADVEEAICRIAQKARACGIHLIVATQRPSVDVITGLIKANIPTRIAFSVSSQVDSRTIIDSGGAEKLLGKGDMLFAENGSSKTVRLQGTFVNDDEIDLVVQHVRNEQEPDYLFEQEDLISKVHSAEESDDLFFEACEFVVSQNAASASSIQRRFHVGYNRASRLIEMMESQGIVSESRGSKPRDVLITEEELGFIQDNSISN